MTRWAESLKDIRDEPSDGADVSVEDAEWLLESTRRARESREKNSIAGWNGGEKVQQENVVTELLLTYVVEGAVSKREPEGSSSIDTCLVKELAVGLKSGLIPLLLTDDSVISVGQATGEIGVSSSSVRRLVTRLEQRGLVKRERRLGQMLIGLTPCWKQALMRPYARPSRLIRIERRLLAGASRIVLDSEPIRIMIDSFEGIDGFETVLQRCLKLAGRTSS